MVDGSDPDASAVVPLSTGGTATRSMDVGPFRVVDARFPADVVLAPHLHDRGAVVVVLAGAMGLGVGNRTLDCEPGTVVSEPVDEPHANHFGRSGIRVLALQPDHDQLSPDEPHARVFDTVAARRDGAARTIAWRLAHELRAPDAVTPLAVHGLGLELLASTARRRLPSDPASPRWLTTVEELLHAHYLDGIDLPAVAAAVDRHPVHVARVVRRHLHDSVGGYVRRLRLDWAVRQVAEGDLPLVEVARRAGYADQSHFTRVFRRRMGVPPGRFRRELG